MFDKGEKIDYKDQQKKKFHIIKSRIENKLTAIDNMIMSSGFEKKNKDELKKIVHNKYIPK